MLITRALESGLVVPDFEEVRDIIKELYEEILPNRKGHMPTYIPQVSLLAPKTFRRPLAMFFCRLIHVCLLLMYCAAVRGTRESRAIRSQYLHN